MRCNRLMQLMRKTFLHISNFDLGWEISAYLHLQIGKLGLRLIIPFMFLTSCCCFVLVSSRLPACVLGVDMTYFIAVPTRKVRTETFCMPLSFAMGAYACFTNSFVVFVVVVVRFIIIASLLIIRSRPLLSGRRRRWRRLVACDINILGLGMKLVPGVYETPGFVAKLNMCVCGESRGTGVMVR